MLLVFKSILHIARLKEKPLIQFCRKDGTNDCIHMDRNVNQMTIDYQFRDISLNIFTVIGTQLNST